MSSIWSIKLCGKEPTIPPCGQPNTSGFNRTCNFSPAKLIFVLKGIGDAVKLFKPQPVGQKDCSGSPAKPIARADGSCCSCSISGVDHIAGSTSGEGASAYLNAKIGNREVIVRLTSLASPKGTALAIWAVQTPNVKLDTCSPAKLSSPCVAPNVLGCGCQSCEQVYKTKEDLWTELGIAPAHNFRTGCCEQDGRARLGGAASGQPRYNTVHPDYINDYSYNYRNTSSRTLTYIPQMRDTATATNYHLTRYNKHIYQTKDANNRALYIGQDTGIAAWQAAPTAIATAYPLPPLGADPNPVRPELQWIAPKSTVQIKDNLFITGTYFGDAVLWKIDSSLQLEILQIMPSSVPTPHTQAVEGNDLVVGETYEVILAENYSNVSASGFLNIGDQFTATATGPLTIGQSVKSTLNVDWNERTSIPSDVDDLNPIDGSYRGMNFWENQHPFDCSGANFPSGSYKFNYFLADMTGTLKEVSPNTFEYLIGTRLGYNKFTVDGSGESITSINEVKVQPVTKPIQQKRTGNGTKCITYAESTLTEGYPDNWRYSNGDTIFDGKIYSIAYEGEGEDYSPYGGPSNGKVGDFFRVTGGDVVLSGSESVYEYGKVNKTSPATGVLGRLAINSATEMNGGEVILNVTTSRYYRWNQSVQTGANRNVRKCDVSCGNHIEHAEFTYHSIVVPSVSKPLEFFVDQSLYGVGSLGFSLGSDWQTAVEFNGSEYLMSIVNGEVSLQSIDFSTYNPAQPLAGQVASLQVTDAEKLIGGKYHHYPIKYGSFYYSGFTSVPFRIIDNGGTPEIELGTHGIHTDIGSRTNVVPITTQANCTYLMGTRKPTGGNGYAYHVWQTLSPPFSP